jgi:RNA polymerase sigma-70 factor (ECF subfamily)
MATPLVSTIAVGPPARAVVRALPFTGDETALVAAMRAGSPAALAAFYDRYHALVYRTLLGVLGPEREIDDLQHDVLLRALGGLDRLEDPCAIRAWLTSIAIFTARTCLLRRSRRRWLRFLPWDEVPEVPVPAPRAEVSEALSATYAILDDLPVDERVAFALRFVEGMELAEAAAACRVSLATIKRRISRAEVRFLARARAHPALAEWVEGGSRWGADTRG